MAAAKREPKAAAGSGAGAAAAGAVVAGAAVAAGGAEAAGAGAEAEAAVEVPPEMHARLESLRRQKKHLEEIKELEAQVRALQQEGSTAEGGLGGGDGAAAAAGVEAPVAGVSAA
jgi:hypothetical protein